MPTDFTYFINGVKATAKEFNETCLFEHLAIGQHIIRIFEITEGVFGKDLLTHDKYGSYYEKQ